MLLSEVCKSGIIQSKRSFHTTSFTSRARYVTTLLQDAQRKKNKKTTPGAVTKICVFSETELRVSSPLTVGSVCVFIHFCFHRKHSCDEKVNHSMVSNASPKLKPGNMSNFQPFVGRKRLQFKFPLWLSFLDPYGKENPRQNLYSHHSSRSHSCPLPWRDYFSQVYLKISNV